MLDKNNRKLYNEDDAWQTTAKKTAVKPQTSDWYDPENNAVLDDRAFLQGLMGDEAGEREYQKQVAEENARVKALQGSFRT